MFVLKYFKNTPGRPHIGRHALSVIFFFKFATRSLKKRGACRPPPTGDRGACRPPSGDQWARPTSAAGGPVALPASDRGGLSPPPRATGVRPLI